MTKKCKHLVKEAFDSSMKDIRTFFNKGDWEGLDGYGLGIDKVDAGTFKGQREDYYRYQLSWGGPSEEFRLYNNGDIEFWYLDWFDGACVDVNGGDANIIREIVSLSFPEVLKCN